MNTDLMVFSLEIICQINDLSDIGTHWIALHALNVTYFDGFGVEHIPKEIKIFIFIKYLLKYLINL